MTDKLTAKQRDTALQGLNGWAYDESGDAIAQVFTFQGFSQAFGFMTRVALAAERAGHHPDWSNAYDTVTIVLSTHDAGGLSDKDIALARAIDAILLSL